ncbi:hypothetical protein [Aliarcobacter butzleri]|uniref:hypothetical protein n=1 Tax=Aliarcobacter butzleri TaxID=28197 RepID=UPI001587AE80|nr:hypothetical protein [Aliarcobacter butzleri]MCT7566983.1 hypothetical protein [Aliarcobacter butzleri]NUW28079.1 hypothetical protein [Aliarcobacter butzleri]
MLKTIHIKTKSLEENGATSSSWFGTENLNIMTIVDGEALAKEIEKQGNLLIKEGYQILSILPITSEKRVSNHSVAFTSSVIITVLKTN